MIAKSTFKPAWWLQNNHVQTLYPLFIKPTLFTNKIEVEYVELNDGDFIELIWSKLQVDNHNSPLVLLLHGLGGGFESHYVGKIFNTINQLGMRCVLMHFRGAGSKPNRLLRSYHAGETNDLDTIIKYLNYKEPKSQKMAIGISMGGSVLLKWLCENGKQPWIKKALAMSVPFELDVSAKCIDQGFSKVYQKHMLSSLKKNIINKIETYSIKYPFSISELMSFNDFYTFDDKVTAPMFGFKNALHYYKIASCRQYLSGIHTPTLILHALDDPFMNKSVIPLPHQLSPEVTLEISSSGGHVGFIEGITKSQANWWPSQRMINYFNEY